MAELRPLTFAPVDIDAVASVEGRIAVFITPDLKLSAGARRLNRLTKGALARATGSDAWEKLAVVPRLNLHARRVPRWRSPQDHLK
jgi:leucyl aminopeptidase